MLGGQDNMIEKELKKIIKLFFFIKSVKRRN